ncbi:ABC-three component system protein [Aquabacter cavernae]|uniref:ABC-three component system protein n=1 Tax=Aquabacter cavernae TaxID=2496029 RepID=UPI000F8C62B5|nr:ABC-three component system protein [Aquabacter cavernae]
MSLVELEKPPQTAAAGQYLGFSLQQLRACFHLFSAADGDSVSLEYLDDVAVHRSDGSLLLEQDKSTLTGNPAADKAMDLWKTFANWATLCTDKVIDPAKTDFRLFITPTKTGTIVAEMSAATTLAACSAVLARIGKLVNPKKPDVGCAPQVRKFLAAKPEICSAIIARFSLVSETDALEGVRQFVRAGLPQAAVDDMTAAAIGIARDRYDRLLREGETRKIEAVVFRRQFQAFTRKSNLAGYLTSKGSVPADELVAMLVSDAPTFVRQLQAVQASNDLLTSAVSDYLRTTSDKIEWAAEGVVVAQSFDELDGQLIRKHTLVRDEVEDVHSSLSEPERGRRVYRECAKVELPLDGQTLPSHFIAGAFNDLADGLRVGWHPAYASLFKGDA